MLRQRAPRAADEGDGSAGPGGDVMKVVQDSSGKRLRAERDKSLWVRI